MIQNINSFIDALVSDTSLKKQLIIRSKTVVYQSILQPLLESYLNDGWVVEKEYKKSIKVSKAKRFDLVFEDEVWCTLARLGFDKLNCKLPQSSAIEIRVNKENAC